MNNHQTRLKPAAPIPSPKYSQGGKNWFAFILGLAIVASPVILGRSYAFYISVLILAPLFSLLWRRTPQSLIELASISAATPIAILRQQLAPNLLFALWYVVFNARNSFNRIPKWIYLPSFLMTLGFATSSINWLSGNSGTGIMRQTMNLFNFFLGPFLFLPLMYVKMEDSRDYVTNTRDLLFCLIVPSTVFLVLAKFLGQPINIWEASLHGESITEGFLQNQFGKVTVNFLRTEVGFIYSALTCASAAIAMSRVKPLFRWVSGACLALNLFLLINCGSFGSGGACLCGLAVILYVQFRRINIFRLLLSVATLVCVLVLTYTLTPPETKKYLEERYEFRVVKSGKDQDRFRLWEYAMDELLEHPEGVGLTMKVGKSVKTFIHNDYLTYAVSFGVIGGLGYITLIMGLLLFFFQLRKNPSHDPYALAIHLAGCGVLFALALNSMTDHSNSNRWYFNVIWSIIWYCYFCTRAAQAKTTNLQTPDPMPSDNLTSIQVGIYQNSRARHLHK